MSALAKFSLKNRMLVMLIAGFVMLMGVVGMTRLNQELIPSIDNPGTYVLASAPGTAPDALESTVAEPLEDAFRAISEVTSVKTVTGDGSVSAVLSWDYGENNDEIITKVKNALSAVEPTLPDGVTTQVLEVSTDQIPVVQVALSGTGDIEELAQQADDRLVPALTKLDGVATATLTGVTGHEVSVSFRQKDLDKYDLTVQTVEQVFAANMGKIAAGQITSDSGQLSVTVGGDLDSVKALAAMPIATTEKTIELKDVADVELATSPTTQITRADGEPALVLNVTKKQDANVVAVSAAAQAEIERLAPSLGNGVTTRVVFDQAPFISQSIENLAFEGGMGLIFAVLVILVFLFSFRSTIIAAVSIPLSIMVTMVGLWAGDLSLNILTLGGLTIAVGRVVDDSIVVIENIKRRQGDGALTVEGVVASVRQVAGAITASTATTVAVFLPIAFVSGIAGELFRPFAVTVTIALLASLLVALTVVPVLAYWFMRRPRKRANPTDGEPADDELDERPDRLQRAYLPVLELVLRRPWWTLLAAGVVLVLTFVSAGALKTDYLGSMDQDTLSISQELPSGATLDDKDAAAQQVEAALAELPQVAQYEVSIGGSGYESLSGDATFTVTLADGVDPDDAQRAIGDALDKISDAGEIEVASVSSSATSSEITVSLSGSDTDALDDGADALVSALDGADGVAKATTDKAEQVTVLRVDVDRDKAADQGFTQAEVAQAVSAALSDSTIGQMTVDGKTLDVVVTATDPDMTAKELEDWKLPVSQLQTARAQQDAADDLADEQQRISDESNDKQRTQLADQLEAAYESRSDSTKQLKKLQKQLAQLKNATTTTVAPTTEPLTAEQQAALAAQQEQQQAIAEVQSAIKQAKAGIEQIDEQIASLKESQAEFEDRLATSERLTEQQDALSDVTGTAVRLGKVAKVHEQTSAATITRQDGERQATVTVTPEAGSLDAASAAVTQALADVDLPSGVSAEIGGVTADQAKSFTQLGLAMLLAVLIVLLIMVATFGNLRQPLVLLISVPFAATGAILLSLITDTPLGLPSMIGLLMLIGIVVTNAIVLMDLMNQLRERGEPLAEAVRHGARLRLRPILMTALATIFALIPMALGISGGGLLISQPLAIIVIGGLVSSTVLTLLLVPVLYTLIERRRERRIAQRAVL